MAHFSVKTLNKSTWPQFAKLVERHNGVWGGCWCMSFHEEGVGRHKTPEQNRSEKETRVVPATRMLRSSMPEKLASVGASSGRRTSFRASSTSAPIAKA
jgi:hypothetical protein